MDTTPSSTRGVLFSGTAGDYRVIHPDYRPDQPGELRRVTFAAVTYQSVEVVAPVGASDWLLEALARPFLKKDRWEPTGDSMEVEVNGIETIESTGPAPAVHVAPGRLDLQPAHALQGDGRIQCRGCLQLLTPERGDDSETMICPSCHSCMECGAGIMKGVALQCRYEKCPSFARRAAERYM